MFALDISSNKLSAYKQASALSSILPTLGMLQLLIRALGLLICVDYMDLLSNYYIGKTVDWSLPTINMLVCATYSSLYPRCLQACHESELVLLMFTCEMLHLFFDSGKRGGH